MHQYKKPQTYWLKNTEADGWKMGGEKINVSM